MVNLKIHKHENNFSSNFEFCTFVFLVTVCMIIIFRQLFME
jgi:hypothetical protein